MLRHGRCEERTMFLYKYPEEKTVAMTFAALLDDDIAKAILTRDFVESKEEAIHLSHFFWRMIEKSAEGNVQLPVEGSSEYWTEKLYNTIGGYLKRAGYSAEWNEEIDKA